VHDQKRNALISYHLKKELEAGKQCILFTERVETAKLWSELVSSWGYMAGPLLGGTDNADETRSTIKLLQTGKCRFASTTSYADVGIDVPTLEAGFITCPTASNDKRIGQQVGRLIRPFEGKRTPIAYYFWDKHVEGISKHIKTIRKKWNNIEEI
jgi:superfamily II DNA or RNA helicase